MRAILATAAWSGRCNSENDLDMIMHFSAFAYVGESVEQPSLYYKNNTIQTVSLLDELIANNVRKFVFSSTYMTYGEPQRLRLDGNAPTES